MPSDNSNSTQTNTDEIKRNNHAKCSNVTLWQILNSSDMWLSALLLAIYFYVFNGKNDVKILLSVYNESLYMGGF